MKSQNTVCCLISAGALALAAVPAFAIPSDVMVYYNNNNVVASATAVEDGTEASGQLYVIPEIPEADLNPAQNGHPIALVEPDSSISDIFGLATIGTVCPLGFMSDPIDLNLAQLYFGPEAGWTFVSEVDGQVYDATAFLSPSSQSAGFTATFTSDGDVPDGGLTLALLGFALAGMEGLRRKLGR
jgi:hypothetical protein